MLVSACTRHGWTSALLGIAFSLISASGATAQTQVADPVIDENMPSVTQWYAEESGAASLGCDSACVALKGDLRRAPTTPTDRVRSRVIKALIDARNALQPPWKVPVTKLGLTGALLVGNYYLWKVKVLGARPREYLIRVPAEAFSPAGIEWLPYDGSNPLTTFPTFHELPSPIPIGVLGTKYARGTGLWNTGSGRCNEPGPTWTPALVETYSWYSNTCFERYDDSGNPVMTPLTSNGWKISLDGLFDIHDGTFPDTPYTYELEGREMTEGEIADRIAQLLNSGDPDYSILGDWLNSVLGGDKHNPKDLYFTVPECSAVAAATCTSRLRDAGFTGSITTTMLSANDAVVELPAGKVTATVPGAGTELAKGTTFVVYQNPATLPKLSSTEVAVATALATKNPTVVDASNKSTLARHCVRLAKAARRSSDDCTRVPIYVQGSDQRGPADNEINALLRNPSWFALNHRAEVARPSPAWYYDRAAPSPGCTQAQKIPGGQCDEFPFWSTLQAYGGTLAAPSVIPSIRWVNRIENRRQGVTLRQFYSGNQPGPSVPFAGCNIAAQSAAEVLPSPASTFLNVPMPAGVPIVTRGICNK